MKGSRASPSLLAGLLLALAFGLGAQPPPQNAATALGGTSWQLVRFAGSDDTSLTPDEKAKYTIEFGTDGRVSARIDCNRGRATWKSPGTNHLELGPLALTRAKCPPAPLTDRIPRHWGLVRSYTIKNGHLFLSLMADGGIYEFEPMKPKGKATPAVKGTNPVERSPDASSSPTVASGGGKTVSPENTYWKLIRLGDKAVIVKSPKEPHLLLDSKGRRMSGSGGCNNLAGSYELNGDQLILRQGVGTMMTCLEGMETEKRFLEALNQVSRWKITAGQLLLSDPAGNAVAGFEARRGK